MTRWTEARLAEYQIKMRAQKGSEQADQGLESRLQGKITKWARDNGYPCLSLPSSPKLKGLILPGWPDITLVVKGRIIFFELKSKKGRLREKQKEMALMFHYLEHTIHKVKSYKKFLEIIAD